MAERYLRFDISRPSHGRPLLWPVHVWKVLYPTQRSQGINLFQQAILSLVRARCHDSNEVAEMLCLDTELVMFIMATQLIPNGWMTSKGAITPKGERVLESAEEASEELRMGYAFQNAISGEWFPRFSESLPEIEAEKVDGNGYPVFLRSRDSGKEDRPFRLDHLKKYEKDLDGLFHAYRSYCNDYAYAKQGDNSDALPERMRIGSVSFVENSGELMWLWTWVFPDKNGIQPWLVSDPMGLQVAAAWLRKPLQEILTKNEHLARYIAGVLKNGKPDNKSAVDWLRSLEGQVELEMMADYSWSRKVPRIKEYLTSVLRIQSQLAEEDNNWLEVISNLLLQTHNLAEAVLQWMLDTYPLDIRRLPHWKDQKEWMEGEAKEYLRFLKLEGVDTAVINKLEGQRLDQVRSAVKRGNSSLKALLFASLLSTIDQEKHPYKTLKANDLAFNTLLDMADARNKKAGHAGSEKISKDEAMAFADFVINWVKLFREYY